MLLVPIPWQPHLFVHPDFLAHLQAASNHLGRNIMLGSVKAPNGHYLSAWRSYDDGVYLWDGWQQHLPGFSSASNPNSGPRSHQRGVGGDLASYATDIIAALRWAGIQVNGVTGEPWHIQLPNFLNYPIITTNTGTAGNGSPIEEDDMPALTPEQDARLKLIEAAIVYFPGNGTASSWLKVPGQDYWWLPAINNKLEAMMQGMKTSGIDIDEAALATKLSELTEAAAESRQQQVLDAITAGDRTVLDAIASVDEATLATFGLQRITPAA